VLKESEDLLNNSSCLDESNLGFDLEDSESDVLLDDDLLDDRVGVLVGVNLSIDDVAFVLADEDLAADGVEDDVFEFDRFLRVADGVFELDLENDCFAGVDADFLEPLFKSKYVSTTASHTSLLPKIMNVKINNKF
jgi:hypothetical protein